MCVPQGHNTVMPVRLEHANPLSQVKHSTSDPLHSLKILVLYLSKYLYCIARNIRSVELEIQ